MSLVSDALRKARQEAAERDGRRDAQSFPSAMVHAGGRSRLGLGLVLGALITLLAAAGGGLGAWWLLGSHTELPSPPVDASKADSGSWVAQAPEHAQPAARPAGEASADLDGGAGTAAPPPASVRGGTAAIGAAPGVTGGQGPGVPAPASPAEATAPDAVPTAAPHPPKRSPAAGPRVYVAEADLGYATLVLDYIAYRPGDPFVQINGVELHEGYHLEGFTVERIGPDEVELRDSRGPLLLRVR